MIQKSEKGQALILIALAMVGLVAFTALAVDGSMIFSDRRHAQNAADTASLAAALARIRGQDYSAAALARASSNGYETDTDSTVEVYLCSDPQATCQGLLPAGAEPSEYIQVKITSIVRTTFARILGRQQVTNVVTAVARAKIGVPGPLFDGAALAALAPTGTDTIYGNGNIFLDVNNSGVFDNSSSNCAMGTVGNGSYTVDTAFAVVGTACQTGNPVLNGPVQQAAQIPYPPTINIPTPSIACSGNGSISQSGVDYTFSPGNFNGINITTSGNVTFTPGNYCFNGGVDIRGTADVTANSVNFLITSGDFQTNGSSTFTTCNNVLVHINGGSGMHFNGNSTNTCTGITFFASTGSVTWNGNVANTFTAPSSGDYAHVLIYLPYENPSALSINGNSGNELTGSIIAVSSPVTISGNSGTTGFHSQIIGYTIALQGGSQTTINYVPEEQYSQTDPTVIQLTK